MKDAMRSKAKAIFSVGVAAADPVAAVNASLDAQPLDCADGRIVVIAVGKAANGMADAVRARINVDHCLTVTNYENYREIDGVETYGAGHPIPDENGLRASNAVMKLLENLRQGDHVIALISGGGSALLPAPVDGISLADKMEVNKLLLESGVDITGTNVVRQNISDLKGGKMLELAQPAKCTTLVLSDVIGDDLRVVASGPTVSAIGGADGAITLLKSLNIWERVPAAVREHLGNAPATVTPDNDSQIRLIGSNSLSLKAIANFDSSIDVVTEPLTGDVSDAAKRIVSGAKSGITVYGGETTVVVTGDGLGGRNQELALRVALLAEVDGWDGPWVFLSGGTDGRDGPTQAAGGLVDQTTLSKMRAAGVDPEEALAANNSNHALAAADALLTIGATGTNVADIQVLIRDK